MHGLICISHPRPNWHNRNPEAVPVGTPQHVRFLTIHRPAHRLLCAWLLLLLSSGAAVADPVKITVRGLDAVARDNLLLHLGTIDERLAVQAARLERTVEHALRDALEPLGYYGATFQLEHANRTVRISVQPGERVLFGEPRIVLDEPAASLRAIRDFIRAAPIRAGEPALHPVFDDFREELLRTCRRYGFFDAVYRHSQLRVDPAALRADAELELDCGTRYRFGETRISGSRVNDELLRALAPFAPDDTFDNALVTRFERALHDTGYFREIRLRVEPGSDQRVAVAVLVEDLDKTRYEFGIGFSTDSSLRLRFNRDTPLLNARGHALRIESELAEPRQTVELRYRIPHHHPLDDYFEIVGGLRGTRVHDTVSLTMSAGARHVLTLDDDWTWTYGATVESERYTVGSAHERDVTYLLPGTSISRTRIDPGIDPLHGSSWFAAVDFSDRWLGSETDFVRLRARAKFLTALPDDNTTLLGRIELGSLFTGRFTATPASLRFAAGGDNSVRGFDFESLGPRDASGQLTGGRHLVVGSIEVSRRILPRWRIAAFTDAGNAFHDRDDEFHQSVGAGVRWLSPVGQIRVDLAVPVHDSRKSGFRIHISMGPPL